MSIKPISQLDLSQKELIIFDLDGTLIDSVGTWDEIDQQLIKHFSGQMVDFATIEKVYYDFVEGFVGTGDELYLAYGGHMNEYYKLNSSAKEVWNHRIKIATHYLTDVFDYHPYADKVLIALKEKGFKLALATNSIGRALDAMKTNKNFDKAALDEVFDFIISSSDVENRKPAPDMYLAVIKHFGVTPDKCLVFEDSLEGVQAGKAAKLDVVNVYDRFSDKQRDEINKLADYRIESYEEVLKILTDNGRY